MVLRRRARVCARTRTALTTLRERKATTPWAARAFAETRGWARFRCLPVKAMVGTQIATFARQISPRRRAIVRAVTRATCETAWIAS